MNDPGFLDRLARLGPALLTSLQALERTRRLLHPPRLAELASVLAPLHERLAAELASFETEPVPEDARPLAAQLIRSARAAERSLQTFATSPSDPPAILEALHQHCQAQEFLYPLRLALPPVSRFFVEPAFHDRLDELATEPPEGVRVGIHRAGEKPPGRGGFSLYVPESYDGREALPLVVALHGGSGNGADFLWSWLSEARGRRFLLLSPTARESTWSMMGPDIDGPAIHSMVQFVQERWRVDASHILLTGLSDGATYTLLLGLQENSPFTALAPVSGVLHPRNLENGNMTRARGKRVYLVHGALDWLFPVFVAQGARDALNEAGADLVYREIADLSHTYPRDENDRILTWFDARLALPGGEPAAADPTSEDG